MYVTFFTTTATWEAQIHLLSSVQFSSVTESCLTLCEPMNRSMPGLPVHHQLPQFTQTHVHWVRDAIQPSHPLSSPSPPAPNPSQHQSFPMSQLFAWGGQSTGVSASASVLPMNTQGWSPLGWTGWIPCSPRDSQESSPTPHFKSINSLALSFLYSPTLLTTRKTIALTRWTSVGKVMSLLFNMLSRFVIAFLPRSKCLLTPQMPAVTIHSDFGVQENKICHCFHFFPVYLPWSDGTRYHDLSLNVEF